MKKFIFYVLLFFITTSNLAQNEHEFVKLTKEKKGKRLKLYAVNTDSISYDVFLRVVTDNYRRSSNRPIITNVPANSKVELITLIHLVGYADTYDATFIVNKVAASLEIDKNHNEIDLRLNKAIKDIKVTLFTSNECLICPETKRILGENKIGYTEYNFEEDISKYLNAVEEFETDKEPINNTFPFLKIKDTFYKNINSIEEFNDILRDAFK